MRVDLTLAELRDYQAPPTEPADFDAFWGQTLTETEHYPLDARFTPLTDAIYRLVRVFDVTFNGWAGQAVRAWLVVPAQMTGRLPTIVTYIGYGGGRSLPLEHLAPAVAGFAHFVMDTRGQGSGWSPGDTPDDAGSGPQTPGFMTRGIESPQTYYYRRVLADAVRAVAAASASPHVDAGRLAVSGGSQGGGIALAVAGLIPERVKLLVADVPFLCHYRRATELTDKLPYSELTAYLRVHRTRVEQVFATLAYFDGVNFAPRVRARSLFSVGLHDLVCPPSTIFAAYNRVSAPKEMQVYEFNEHEGGGPFAADRRLRFLAEHL